MAKKTVKQQAINAKESWADTLRHAITADGRSGYAICKAASTPSDELQRSVLKRFMQGASINLTTAERLGRVVGITFEARRTSKS